MIDVHALNGTDPATQYDSVPWFADLLACRRCGCRDEAKRVVPGVGPRDARIMVVGQNPGAEEDETGTPFVGRGGEELDIWLRLLGLQRTRVIVTNIVKCFPEGTLVEASGVQRAYRRWYSGDLVRAVTPFGELSGTPNHPVLTPHGWVPLGLLQQGGDLVCGSFRQGVALRDPDVQRGPTQIAELFDALALLGVRQRVVGSYMDFHGDGGEAKVEVVGSNRLLRDRVETEGLQHSLQHVLEPANDGSSDLVTLGAGAGPAVDMFRRVLPSLGCSVSLHGQGCPNCWGGQTPPVVEGVGSVSYRDAGPSECSPDNELADLHPYREREETLPSVVGLARILYVERSRFSGHVYNLQTVSEEYVANGFIVHNCHTTNNRKPRTREINICQDAWLKRELETFTEVQAVIPLGRPALEGLVGKIEKVPEVMTPWWMTVDFGERRLHLLPLAHPAFLLRAPGQRSAMYERVLPWVRAYLEREVPSVYRA